MSAFAKYRAQAWPYQFAGTIRVSRICGGIPTDPKVAEGWLRTKLGVTSDNLVQQQVAEVMVERGITADEAVAEVNINRHLNGFKRDDRGLYIEGRQLKAAIKEAASVAVAADKLNSRGWGKTNKGLLNFLAEHVCVVEDKLHLGLESPTGVAQRFVSTWRGTGIQYEEYVDNAEITFTVITDHQFAEKDWAMIWLTGEQQGIGATRSQGYGRYEVLKWEQVR